MRRHAALDNVKTRDYFALFLSRSWRLDNLSVYARNKDAEQLIESPEFFASSHFMPLTCRGTCFVCRCGLNKAKTLRRWPTASVVSDEESFVEDDCSYRAGCDRGAGDRVRNLN